MNLREWLSTNVFWWWWPQPHHVADAPSPAAVDGGVRFGPGEAYVAPQDVPHPPENPIGPMVPRDTFEDNVRPGPRTGERHDFTYHHLRRDLSDLVADVLDRFELIEHARGEFGREKITALEHLWGCDFLMFDKSIAERMKGGDRWSAISHKDVPEAEFADTVWPIDFACAFYTEDREKAQKRRATGTIDDLVTVGGDDPVDDDPDKEGMITFIRLRSVTREEVRGRVKIVVPRMLHFVIAHVNDKGWWNAMETYVGVVGGKWTRIKPGNEDMSINWRRWLHDITAWIIPSVLTARYEWHVALGSIKGGPRVLLPTNPSQCLKLFKDRDVAPGKTRRDKLRHWVETHYRDDDEFGLEFVCAHLRGHTRFTWADFDCELFVSAFDLEKAEFFKQQAKEWRAQRRHNRVKVRFKR